MRFLERRAFRVKGQVHYMKTLAKTFFLIHGLLGMLLVVLALDSSSVSAAEARGAAKIPPFKMRLKDGKLTAQISTAPLRSVIMEISRLAGAEVRWLTQEEDNPVSAEFTDLPLHEALETVLRENFTLSYTVVGSDKKLVGIWIASRSEFRRTFETTNSLSITRGSHPENAQERDLTRIVTAKLEPKEWREEAVPVEPGSEINLADAPPSVRLKAIESLATHAKNDQEVRTILLHFAHNDPDPQVREMASSMLSGMR
jgi:hypothetical protein